MNMTIFTQSWIDTWAVEWPLQFIDVWLSFKTTLMSIASQQELCIPLSHTRQERSINRFCLHHKTLKWANVSAMDSNYYNNFVCCSSLHTMTETTIGRSSWQDNIKTPSTAVNQEIDSYQQKFQTKRTNEWLSSIAQQIHQYKHRTVLSSSASSLVGPTSRKFCW